MKEGKKKEKELNNQGKKRDVLPNPGQN